MSAFAVVFERSNQQDNPQVFERVFGRLNHRGPDGRDEVAPGRLRMGHWHFWTTPEEVGERQPLTLPGLPFTLVFDGRLDNRPELLADLGMAPGEGAKLSDAAVVLRCYARWGQACFTRFVGEFALAIYDQSTEELVCARDHLGDRTLFYTVQGTQVVIASEPWAVTGAIPAGAGLNENVMAASFIFRVPLDGQTLFKDVYEVLPAHTLTIKPGQAPVARRYWQPDLSRKLRGLTDQEYADQFRALLEQSVLCRLRATTPAGVMMSGGLDSTSVACFAARAVAPQALTTLSYVFDELKECDERQNINAMAEKWGLNSIQIPCDDAWTYRDWQNWPHNPNRPEHDMYRLVHERIYERAQAEGLRILLDGDFGDHLYGAGIYWLADLLSDGKPLTAARELSVYIRYLGWRKTWQLGYIQRVPGHFLNFLPGGRTLHFQRPSSEEWLTEYANQRIKNIEIQKDRLLERYNSLLGMNMSRDASGSEFYYSRHRLEIRHPYRDRRLIEFALSLPAYQLFLRGSYKHILRNAMVGLLPESIRTCRRPTSYFPFALRGFEQGRKLLQSSMHSTSQYWHQFVRIERILKDHREPSPDEKGSQSVLIPWLCLSNQAWFDYFNELILISGGTHV